MSRTGGYSFDLKPITGLWKNSSLRVIVVALVYFATAQFSLSLVINHQGIAAIWPPSGIFLSAVLLSRRKERPLVVGVLFLTDFLAELLAGTPAGVSLCYSLALAGDAVFSSWLLLRFVCDPFTFRSYQNVLGFLLLSVVLSNSLMSLIAAAAAAGMPPYASFWMEWLWWAASTGIGNLFVTPFILSWSTAYQPGLVARISKWAVEEIIILFFIVLLNYFAFVNLFSNNQFGLLLTYLNFPFLLWAASRQELRGTTLALIFLAGITIRSAVADEMTTLQFAGTQLNALLIVQLYLVVMAVPSLILAAIATDHNRTERALRENETRYRSLFFDSPIPLLEVDFSQIKHYLDQLRAQGTQDFEAFFDAHPDEILKCIRLSKILDINQAAFHLLGGKSKGELFTSLKNITAPDILFTHKKTVLAIAQGETTSEMEVTSQNLSGEMISVSLKWAIPVGYEKTYQKAFISMVDVTSRNMVEHDLRKSEERFRQLAENIKDVFWIINARTEKVEYVSPAYTRIWEKTQEELYADSSNWIDAIHPEDKNRVLQAFLDRHKNESYDAEFRIVTPGNTTYWIHDRGFPVFDKNGQMERWVGVAEDITERKLVEKALRERNYFIESILENAPIGFAINKISDGIGTFVSSKFDAIYGVPRGSINTVDEYFERAYLDPVFREQIRLRIMTDMASGDPARMSWEDIPITTCTGENKVVTAINIPLFEQDLMISTVQDVTKRWHAEQEIRRQNQELDKIRMILGNLSSQFDIKSVLNRSLQGALELSGAKGGIIFLVDSEKQDFSDCVDINPALPRSKELNLLSLDFKNAVWRTAMETVRPTVTWNATSGHKETLIAALSPEGIQFFAFFPLQIKNQCAGVLCLFESGPKEPADQSLDLIHNLCGPIALAIENAKLYDATRHEAQRAEALARTAARLIAQMDFDTLIHIVCEEAARALDASLALLFLYDPQQEKYSLAAHFGLSSTFQTVHQVMPGIVYEKLIANYGASGVILPIQEYHHMMAVDSLSDIQVRSIIGVNILQGSERIGFLGVGLKGEANQYSKEDLNLIQGIADQSAQAITRARLFEQVSTGRKHLQTLSMRLLEVQESERRALALELHDELGQLLNSAKMSLDLFATLPPQAAEEHFHRAQNLISDLVTRVREMSLQLRPSMLDDLGLLPALRWLFKNYQSQTGRAVTFKETNLDRRFPPQVEITAYRIIQEGLTNIIRHAGEDKQVRVEGWADERALYIQIRDRGKGFSPTEMPGRYESSGLSGMRERARLLGGELVVESAPGAGTNLSVSLPLVATYSERG